MHDDTSYARYARRDQFLALAGEAQRRATESQDIAFVVKCQNLAFLYRLLAGSQSGAAS